MFSIRNLTKSYRTKAGRHYVFRDINIDFPENVNIGILGPNGAGKSTLLKILGGIDYPDYGTIECDKSISWPLGLRGGFVGNLSGRANCKIVCNLYGVPHHQLGTKLDYIKELSGIGKYFEEPVKYYSSGMNSRVGFALSMAFDFEVMLIDEITTVGDRNFRTIAKETLTAKSGRSNVIMVSHSMSNIREFCDVGILLRDGKMQVFLDLDEAIKAYLPGGDEAAKAEKQGKRKAKAAVEFSSDYFESKESHEEAQLREIVAGLMRQIEQAIADGEELRDAGKFYHFVGICYSRLGDYAKAYQYHQLAVAEHEDVVGYHTQLIAATMQLGLFEQTEDAINEALNWWPSEGSLYNQLGALKSRLGNWQECVDAYAKAIEFMPDNAGVHNAYATVLAKLGHHELALEEAMRALSIDSSKPAFYRNLSGIFAQLSRFDEAAQALKEAEFKAANTSKGSDSTLKRLQALRGMLEKAAEFLP